MSKILRSLIVLALFVVSIPFICWFGIEWYSSGYITEDSDVLAGYSVALVLGTSPYIGNRNNLFYTGRINASHDLYRQKKLDSIIVSGDNLDASYNEPKYMYDSLVGLGINKNAILQDGEGYRTLDSVLRARDTYGYDSYIIVSQPFHLKRAIFLARSKSIDAIGYPAKSIPFEIAPRVYLREVGARVKAVFEIVFFFNG